jgi:hypothetical protein
VSRPQGGRVQEAQRIEPTLEAVVRSGSHRREANLQDARGRQRCHQHDAVHDSGAAINLMLCTMFKKLVREDDKLMKTNLMINGMGAHPMEAKGVVSMELTITFFVIEVPGNYSVILDHNWIHANRCVPSTLHQFLIWWIDDEIEVVHADALAYIALADAAAGWQHESV